MSHIQAYSQLCATLVYTTMLYSELMAHFRTWGLTCFFLFFFENRKKYPDFGKTGFDCVHLWVKFCIHNVVLRVSRKKNSIGFTAGPFFLVFLMKCIWKCPSSTKSPQSWKISGCAPTLRYYSFCKMLHLKCLTTCWTRLFFSNCSVICTVTLWYILHQRDSEFWLI